MPDTRFVPPMSLLGVDERLLLFVRAHRRDWFAPLSRRVDRGPRECCDSRCSDIGRSADIVDRRAVAVHWGLGEDEWERVRRGLSRIEYGGGAEKDTRITMNSAVVTLQLFSLVLLWREFRGDYSACRPIPEPPE